MKGPHSTSLFLAIPCYSGQIHPATKQAIQESINTSDHQIMLGTVGGDAILDRARAFLFAQYLKSGAEWYAQIDADIQWHPETLDRMIGHGKLIIGALYTFKVKPGHPKYQTPVFQGIGGEMPTPDGLLKVRALGGGCIFVHRSVFEKMMEDRPDELIHINPDYGEGVGKPGSGTLPSYHFWQSIRDCRPEWGENHFEYLSEDYALCKRARESGFEIYADARVRLRHWQGDRFHELNFDPEAPPQQEAA